MRSLAELISTVEVEINSRCNRHCGYCPVSVLPVPNVPRHMRNEVFGRLLAELARINFSGRLSYHFYNEPLLRKDLEQLVALAQEHLPNVHQVLFTNGDLLTNARYDTLIGAGVGWIVVTAHDGLPYPERPKQTVQFPSDLILTNRGGTMEHLPKVTSEMLQAPCYAPSEMLIVTVDGYVTLCYEDAQREYLMGNIMESGLEDIWFSEQFTRIRNLVAARRRAEAAPICRACTNVAHAIPGTSHLP